jgi:hypothetical protein
MAGLFGCEGEPPEPPDREPFYVNNSGVAVNLILVTETKRIEYAEEDTIYYKFKRTTRKQEIKNNDTLCNYYLSGRNCSQERYPWEIPNYWDESSVYFKIEFLSEPKNCLVFDGDKVDNDIRYWENYILTEETPLQHGYYYYITSQHKAMARKEDCHRSIGTSAIRKPPL